MRGTCSLEMAFTCSKLCPGMPFLLKPTLGHLLRLVRNRYQYFGIPGVRTVTLNLVRLQKRSGRLNVNTLLSPSPSPRANHSPSPRANHSPKPRPIRSTSHSPSPSPNPTPSPSLRKFNCERA